MRSESILLMFHCEQDTGYAIKTLERVFFDAAVHAGFEAANVYWSFKKITNLISKNYIEIDYVSPSNVEEIKKFIISNNIKLVIAFDLNFPCKIITILRRSDVKYIISYVGASISSINFGLKLFFKKMECILRVSKPNFFIFESNAMKDRGINGRGLSKDNVSVVNLGVDIDKFYPDYNNCDYAYRKFKIPNNRKIVFYSGHMEKRKGIDVIIDSAIYLVDIQNFYDVHFLICGNKNDESLCYENRLIDFKARDHVTFAGYRDDIELLMRSSYLGVITSTGWDSFTMSSVEMMASGLPMIVSDLQGLAETITHNFNGFLFPPGDYLKFSMYIKFFVLNIEVAKIFSSSSRIKATTMFDRNQQVQSISNIIKQRLA